MRRLCLLFALLPAVASAQSPRATPVDKRKSEQAFREAQAAYRAKRYPESVRAFRASLRHWPDNPGALNDLAWLYVSAVDERWIRPRLAFPLAERAVALDPDNDAYLDTLATAYDLLGRHLEAARIEGRALKIDPKRREYGVALVKFARSALTTPQPDPTRAELWRLAARGRLAQTASQRGEPRRAGLRAALNEAREALKLAPGDAAARALEGRALAGLGRHAPAVVAFQAALRVEQDPELRRRLAGSLSALGRHAEAAAALTALVSGRPGDHTAWERLVEAHRSAGAHARASRAADRAVAALGLHPPLWPTRRAHRLRLLQAKAHDALALAAADAVTRRAERTSALRARVRAAAVRTAHDGLDAVIAKGARELDPTRAETPLPALRRALAVEVLGPAQDVRFREAPLPAWARGGRVALADVDGDGDPDLLLSGRRLLLNDGRGRFTRAPGDAGLGRIPGVGGVFADADRDGDLDLYVISHAKGGDRLLRNDSAAGRVTFTDVTTRVGSPTDDLRSEGAAWGDLNGDGYPDIYVANYEKPGKAIARGTHDRLWLSDGLGGFVDASKRVRRGPYCGRGVAMADVDQDGDLDVFVSNYRLNPDLLWLNDGAGGLTDVAVKRGVAGWRVGTSWGHTIGSTWGDLDNDGDLDLVASKLAHPRFIHFSDTTRVFLQQPNGRFTPAESRAGIAFEETHSDPTLLDVDDDGDLDLFLTSVYGGRPSFLWRNQLGASPGSLRFVDVTWAAGVRIYNGWGAAAADVDMDGDQDLVVAAGGRARLFLNERVGAKSVRLRLRGTRSDTWGAGATVVLRDGQRRWVRQLTLGHGTTSQSEPIVHFGVGKRPGPFSVEVRWPSRLVSTHRVGPGRHELREP